MSGVKKSTAAAIIKLTEWLTFQSCFQLLLCKLSIFLLYCLNVFLLFSNDLNKMFSY